MQFHFTSVDSFDLKCLESETTILMTSAVKVLGKRTAVSTPLILHQKTLSLYLS